MVISVFPGNQAGFPSPKIISTSPNITTDIELRFCQPFLILNLSYVRNNKHVDKFFQFRISIIKNYGENKHCERPVYPHFLFSEYVVCANIG